MPRVPNSISVRLKTEETPALGSEWERLEKEYGMDGAAFIRQLVSEIVNFERKHGRVPKLRGLTIAEHDSVKE